MPEYGATDQGFVLKRLDVIREEIHADLSRTVEDGGLGIDTRLLGTSFLNTLIATFSGTRLRPWSRTGTHSLRGDLSSRCRWSFRWKTTLL